MAVALFDDEEDTISLDEELEPLMITGDLEGSEPTRPVTKSDSIPLPIIDDETMFNKRAATSTDWPPTPKRPSFRRRAGVDRAITTF